MSRNNHSKNHCRTKVLIPNSLDTDPHNILNDLRFPNFLIKFHNANVGIFIQVGSVE